MGTDSKIEWCSHTFNPWWGCTKVSPACAHCYAESFAKRTGHAIWSDAAPRRFFGAKHWDEPLKWDRAAAKSGRVERVFCASMADIFEIHPDPEIAARQDEARRQLARVIAETPNLRWLLLTKRPENWSALGAQLGWCLGPSGWYEPTGRIWMGATTENDEYFERRSTNLIKIPAAAHFVSYEPALGPIGDHPNLAALDWVICGSESGPRARSADLAWFKSMRRRCAAAGTAFFMKQITERGHKVPFEYWPEDLQVRQFPPG